jgi:hypothetical protein
MKTMDFNKLVLEAITLYSFSAADLFTKSKTALSGSKPTKTPIDDIKPTYSNKFSTNWPNDLTEMVAVMNANPMSRGGSRQYEKFADQFPLLDLMCLVSQENGLGAGKFNVPSQLNEDKFKAGSLYEKWFKDYTSFPTGGSSPLDWKPLSGKGIEVLNQLNKDAIQKYAAEFSLKNYSTKSIMYAITQLLEVRKEMRWNVFTSSSSLKIPFTKSRDRTLPKRIYQIFEDPLAFAGGKTQFPADIKNKYDQSGGLEERIYELALTCQRFYDFEVRLYFGSSGTPEASDTSETRLIEVLENKNVEAGSSSGLFYYLPKNPSNPQVPADKLGGTNNGKGGYTIGNLEEYSKENTNPYAKNLWEKLVNLAEYTKTNTWSWSSILGGANQINRAIGGFAGSFGK